jgi:hypothetical protein
MKRIALSMVAGLGLLALVPTAAMAHTDVSLGLNLGGGYYAPEPTYVAPAPVYYEPAPVYYGPRVVYREDYDDGDYNYRREVEEHYRRHNEWVRNHPWEGGRIEHPRW